jgi:hypothetical protein
LSFKPAPPLDVANGLLGKVDLLVHGLFIREVRVRRSADGRNYLGFPMQSDQRGRRWHPVRPYDDATRIEIERQVFAQLHREGRLAS